MQAVGAQTVGAQAVGAQAVGAQAVPSPPSVIREMMREAMCDDGRYP